MRPTATGTARCGGRAGRMGAGPRGPMRAQGRCRAPSRRARSPSAQPHDLLPAPSPLNALPPIKVDEEEFYRIMKKTSLF
jgi:hypothetical protein